MIKYWVIPPWLPIFLIGILVNVSTAVLSNQLFWWLTLGFGDFPRFYLLLVGPSLDPVTRESRRFLLIQNTQPTAQWKGHTQLKEAGKEGKKEKKKTSRVISCSSRSAFLCKTLGMSYSCSHPPALLMASSHHLFPLGVDISKDFGSLTCSWKAERQESLHILEKTRFLAKPHGNVNSQRKRRRGGDMRHSPYCRKQLLIFIWGINIHFRNFISHRLNFSQVNLTEGSRKFNSAVTEGENFAL